MQRDFKKLAQLALEAANEKKAINPMVLDLRGASDISDYMLIATAESSTQMRAIVDSVEETLKLAGASLLRRDGRPGNRWMAIDYGGLVVHVLTTEAREFFRLEQIFEDAKKLPEKKQVARKTKAPPKKRKKS